MQGKLQEIDIRSILQLIELGQRTGELFVEASPSVYWFVFFLNGRIIYASETEGNIARLRDYLHRFKLEAALEEIQIPHKAAVNAPEYNRLWSLLESHKLNPNQGKQILLGMVREVLFDLLSLHHGSFIFEAGSPLAPQLTTFPVTPLLTEIVAQVQEWKKLHPYIQAPNQAPTILNPIPLQQHLPAPVFKALSEWSDGKTSIRQMSRYLGRDTLTVAKAIYPYVRQGAIQLSEPVLIAEPKPSRPLKPSDKPSHILCIDDSMAIQKTVEFILQNEGYQVTTIGNPLKALGQVFLLNPDMILCDVAMPKLDGYELCAMLRKSSQFRETPMIMLTGKDGFTDRIKARMAGANEFLSKPFAEKELLTIVESYVGPPPKRGGGE
ncbi:response regulator [Synechococcus sp. W60.1]|uniref:response regulator n=2 Tax=unclassified Synechococcus TaxID=2626047 RepID=UPI0039C1A79C